MQAYYNYQGLYKVPSYSVVRTFKVSSWYYEISIKSEDKTKVETNLIQSNLASFKMYQIIWEASYFCFQLSNLQAVKAGALYSYGAQENWDMEAAIYQY